MGLHEEYVALLRRHGVEPPETMTPREFATRVEEQFLRPPGKCEPAERLVQELAESFARYKTQFFELDLYTAQVGSVLAENRMNSPIPFYFGEFPTNEFNAVAQPTDSGALCLVNTGLIQFLQNFSKACLSNAISDASGNAVIKGREGITNLTHSLGAAISVAHVYLIHSKHNAHSELLKSNNAVVDSLAIHLSNAMISFVVAHELCHVLLGHVHAAAPQQQLLKASGKIMVVNKSRDQELSADVSAQRMLVSAATSDATGYGTVGGICFLTAYLFIERLIAKYGAGSFDDAPPECSHPSARERILLLADHLKRDAGVSEYDRYMVLFDTLWFLVELLDRTEIVLVSNTENRIVALLGVLVWPDVTIQPFIVTEMESGQPFFGRNVQPVILKPGKEVEGEAASGHLSEAAETVWSDLKPLLTAELEESAPFSHLPREQETRHLDMQLDAFWRRFKPVLMEKLENEQMSSEQEAEGENKGSPLGTRAWSFWQRLKPFFKMRIVRTTSMEIVANRFEAFLDERTKNRFPAQ